MPLRFIFFSLLATLAAGRALAGTEPQRVVSMNLCLDSVLVELVPRDHILALSQYSRDPWRSTIAGIAATLPYTNETAEEVVALRPDLVLASRHSAIATRNALARVGVRFELFGVPQTIDESLQQIRRLATLLHRKAEGEALIGRIQNAIVRARPAPGERTLTAAIYQPGGLTTGANTVVGQLMSIAGLDNVAAGAVMKLKPVAIRRIARPEESASCHTLFISASEDVRIGRIIEALEHRPVLTVSDAPGFAQRGGMIGFSSDGRRIRFTVNLTAAEDAGLMLNSELLRVAVTILRPSRPGQ